MTNLLPPNSTSLERRLAAACSEHADLDADVVVRVTRVDAAPAEFLPYLAWEASVDRWSDAWADATKRKIIKDAFYVHKRKGTIGSLRRVVEPFGYLLRVVEWFQEDPPGPRATFRLDIGVNEQGITDEVYAELERLIFETKPLSRHMTGLSITILVQARYYMACAAYLGDTVTVYPPAPQDIEIKSRNGMAGASHTIDTLTVSMQ
ncbi:phage tail protein I [Alcaligenaceae bacterium SJ-26]|nr:phage tail protein I [Alcaligenaceae bacterium SJ-26]